MWSEELLSSYTAGSLQALRDSFTVFPNQGETAIHDMVTESEISFTSTCAHHLLPFSGKAYVGYIPSDLLVGLSKFPRVVDYFSRMLQLQERLTAQVADFIQEHLNPQGVIVLIDAEHSCMSCRGVRKADVLTSTCALRGVAREAQVKDEFYRLIRRK